jgi:hypothetical protein
VVRSYGVRSKPDPDLLAVVPTILRAAAAHPARFRAGLKYSLPAVVEKVVFRRESVAACVTGVTSYIWGSVALDGGEPVVELDFGRLPMDVEDVGSKGRRYRINWPQWEAVEGPGVGYLLGIENCEDWMLRTGLALGQPFLLGMTGWATGGEDPDCGTDVEMLYRDPTWARPPGSIYLPIPL